MKKRIVAPLLVLCIGLAAATDAAAGPEIAPALTGTVKQPVFMLTLVKGEIAVPATFSSGSQGGSGPLALGGGKFGCSNLAIIAQSKAMKPTSGDGFPTQHVWSHSAQATGTYASGKCSYAVAVPAGSEFHLVAGTSGNFDCQYISVDMNGTPTWQSVPKGTHKTDNLNVKSIVCGFTG